MARPAASDDVFRAVADPTRRAVLEILGRETELPVTALAERLDVSLPLMSRHLAVLRETGLVAERRTGRQRLYHLQPGPLRELYDWASVFSGFWAERIQSLHTFMDNQETGKQRPDKRRTDKRRGR